MSATTRKRLLEILAHDSLARQVEVNGRNLWRTPCLHCRSMLYVDLEGVAVSAVTLEHIVPQAWFERSKVIAALNLPFVDRNDTKNLALACPRCNHDKGKGHDTRANDPRARAVVLALLEKRLARYLDA